MQDSFKHSPCPENKSNMIEIYIIDSKGNVNSVNVENRCKIDKLKVTAVSQILGPNDSSKQSLYYKLVSLKHNYTLSEARSLVDEGIKTGDELLLLEKRMDIPEIEDSRKRTERLKAPSAQDIKVATCNILPKNVAADTEENPPSSALLQDDCRKILVTLTDTAHRLHCMNAALADVFNYPHEAKADKPGSASEPKLQYSHSKLRQLTMMGFPEHLVKIALHKNKDVPSAAIQWLLDRNASGDASKSTSADVEQGIEVTEDMPLDSNIGNPSAATNQTNAEATSANQKPEHSTENETKANQEFQTGNDAETTEKSQNSEAKANQEFQTGNDTKTTEKSQNSETSSMQFDGALNKESGPAKVDKLLKSFKAFARDTYDADAESVAQLCEMGFSRRDVLDALRLHEGRQQAACEWLLSGEHIKAQEMTEGVDPHGALYTDIHGDEHVQLALQNPICIIAFLMMLESPTTTERWLANTEIGSLLVSVANIYAKHRDDPNTS